MYPLEDRTITATHSSPTVPAEQSVLEIWGGQPLRGHAKVSGAKNSALVIMAGVLLCSGHCRIGNVPQLADVASMSEILAALGVKVSREGDVLNMDAQDVRDCQAPYELVSRLRASFFAIGPLLARLGVAKIPLPGGCAIGARPVDIHVRGLRALGANVQIEHGMVHAYVPGPSKRLKGAKIYFDCPSVGATETLMMAATLAEGETILENVAQEPEVIDLANFCNAMGAKIRGAGTTTITIEGVPSLHSVEWDIIPDRIEAGTFLIAGAITHSEITVGPIVPEHLTALLAKMEAIGNRFVVENRNLRIIPDSAHRATDVETLPFPGFPTDMQAQLMALLTLSEGNSVITETLFENRFQHVAELCRMGADIRVKGNNAIIRGVSLLSGAPVEATDLRAGAALVVAGLAAEGKTIVKSIQYIDRGYEDLDFKLRAIGARIQRLDQGIEVPELIKV